MKRDQRFENAYIFGAVCPAEQKGAALVSTHVNTKVMNLHLQEISRTVAEGAHAVILMDGASYHRTPKLTIPTNLSLLYLPPYDPEDNGHENVWAYLRSNYFAGKIFNSLDEIMIYCCTVWNLLMEEKDRIQSLAQREWFSLNINQNVQQVIS
jgi:transposase